MAGRASGGVSPRHPMLSLNTTHGDVTALWRTSSDSPSIGACAGAGSNPHLRLRPLQPIRHSHVAVQGRRRGEVLLRLLALARAAVELAEAEVAVGDERAHAAWLGECERLAVVGLAALGIEPVGMGRDVAE